MQAYLNKPELKEQVLATVREHCERGDFVQGTYLENWEGSPVGCLLKDPEGGYMRYEGEYGIPVMLALLQNSIFEGLSSDEAKRWPLCFHEAIKTGSDLSQVGWRFLHWVLTDELRVSGKGDVHSGVRQAIKGCADAIVPLMEGKSVDADTVRAAADIAAISHMAIDGVLNMEDYSDEVAAYVTSYAAEAARSAAVAVIYATNRAGDSLSGSLAADKFRIRNPIVARTLKGRHNFVATYFVCRQGSISDDVVYIASCDAANAFLSAVYAARSIGAIRDIALRVTDAADKGAKYRYNYHAVRGAAYKRMADKLLELIANVSDNEREGE